MTGHPPVEFGDLVEVVQRLMGEHPIASPDSAANMKVILDKYEGAIVTGHGHDHVHVITGFDIAQTAENVLTFSVRTSRCPPEPPV